MLLANGFVGDEKFPGVTIQRTVQCLLRGFAEVFGFILLIEKCLLGEPGVHVHPFSFIKHNSFTTDLLNLTLRGTRITR